MAKKRTSLAAVADALMSEPSKTGSVTERNSASQFAKKKAAPVEEQRKGNTIAEASDSAETIRTSVYIPLAVYKKLNELAITESTGLKKKVNDYFLEGIDEVFAKRGLPPIAKLIKRSEE